MPKRPASLRFSQVRFSCLRYCEGFARKPSSSVIYRTPQCGLEHLPQHVGKDAAVLIVSGLFRRIRASDDLKRLRLALIVARLYVKLGAWRELAEAFYGEGFMAAKPEGFRAFARFEFQRQHAHPQEVAAMNPFIAFRNYRTHPQQKRSLGCPIA